MSVSTLHLLSTEGKPLVRFELTTHALRMRCSTPELQRQMLCAATAYHTPTPSASLFLEKNHIFFNFLSCGTLQNEVKYDFCIF